MKRSILVMGVVCLFTPSPAVALTPRERSYMIVSAHLLDAGVTRWKLEGGGGREGNPLVVPFAHSTPKLFAFKASTGVFLAWVQEKMERDGHPTAAKWAAWLSVGWPLAGVTVSISF